jgi:molybdate transport system substrate-binding protein
MLNSQLKVFALLFVCQFFISTHSVANEIRIAVASNFYPTMKAIVEQFELENYESSKINKIVLISGSSGKHYAQIMNGAPFDIFFSADKVRPVLLEKEGIVENESRFTYALGKIVLWSPANGFVDPKGQVLYDNNFRFLAIANPKIAPYGIATKETLVSMGLWKNMDKKLVRGENIAQAFQFINTGNAKLGFVSFSQLMSPNFSLVGSFWEVPKSLYNPIEQQAVLLRDSLLGRNFMEFVQTDKALNIISKFGYDLP